MKKELLEEYISKNLSIRDISHKTNKSFSTIRYWLKKYNLKTNFVEGNKINYGEKRKCPKCQKDKNKIEFYNRRGKLFSSSYCKSCVNTLTLERMRRFKELCVEYKGGKCCICGYNKCISALEFHHTEPDKKDFTIAHMKKYKFNEYIKLELDKCVLLCSNCHREVESGITTLN